jgi:hypothetical protein
MDVAYINKCQYEYQEQKEVPVWYTGQFQHWLSVRCDAFMVVIEVHSSSPVASHFTD